MHKLHLGIVLRVIFILTGLVIVLLLTIQNEYFTKEKVCLLHTHDLDVETFQQLHWTQIPANV